MQSLRSNLTARATVALTVLVLGATGGVLVGCGGDAEPASDEIATTVSIPTAATATETNATDTATSTTTVPATTVRTPSAVTSPSSTLATPPAQTTTTPKANPGGVVAPEDDGATKTTTTPRQDPDCKPGTGPGQPLPQCEPVSGPDANEDEG